MRRGASFGSLVGADSTKLEINPRSINKSAINVATRTQQDREWQRLSKTFKELEIIGQGSMTFVRRAVGLADGKEVALKIVRSKDHEVITILEDEYELLKTINHEHIVKALDLFKCPDFAVLALEYFDSADLKAAIKAAPNGRFEEKTARRSFLQLLRALAYLHEHGLVHRDIKPENILVSKDLQDLRLIDFNCARRLSEAASLTMTGTRIYCAPEVLLGSSPSKASDVWSVGLCLYFMMRGSLPISASVQRTSWHNFVEEVSTCTAKVHGPAWESVSDGCKSVILDCLVIEEHLRPTATTILESKWFGAV
jgi:serine/threonine protein kinase